MSNKIKGGAFEKKLPDGALAQRRCRRRVRPRQVFGSEVSYSLDREQPAGLLRTCLALGVHRRRMHGDQTETFAPAAVSGELVVCGFAQ